MLDLRQRKLNFQ